MANSSNPPWWWKIGAALKGGDMLVDTASKATGLVDWYEQRGEQQRAAEELAKMQNDMNYTPDVSKLRTFSTGKNIAPRDAVLAQYDKNKQLQAAPALDKVQSALQDFGYADNNFTPSEWTKGIADMYAPDAPKGNTYFNEGLKAFEKKGANVNSLNRGDIATMAVTDPTSLKSYVDAGKDMAATAKTKQEMEFQRLDQEAVRNIAQARQAYTALPQETKQSMKPEEKIAFFSNLANNPNIKETAFKTAIDALDMGDKFTYHNFNPTATTEALGQFDRYGNVKQIGEGVDPARKAAKITVDTGDKTKNAYATSLGPEMSKTIKESHSTASAAVELLDTANKMSILRKGAETGLGQAWVVQAKRVADSLGIPTSGLSNQQLYDALSTGMSIAGAKMLGANPTDNDLKAITKSYPGISKTAATNIWLENNIKAKANRTLKAHQNLVDRTRSISPEAADFYTVKPPLSSY